MSVKEEIKEVTSTKHIDALKKILVILGEAKTQEDFILVLNSAMTFLIKISEEHNLRIDALADVETEIKNNVLIPEFKGFKEETKKEFSQELSTQLDRVIKEVEAQQEGFFSKTKKDFAEDKKKFIESVSALKKSVFKSHNKTVDTLVKEVEDIKSEQNEKIEEKIEEEIKEVKSLIPEIPEEKEELAKENKTEIEELKKELEKTKDELKIEIAKKPSGGGGGTSALGVRQAFKRIAHTEEPSGAIDGANTTYTVQNEIWWVAGFSLNGEQITELPNFTYAGRTITFASAIPGAYSGKDFEIKYIG